MTRATRWILVCLAVTLVAVVSVAVSFAGSSSTKPESGAPSSGDPLTSVTPYQLEQMRLELADPDGTPAVSAESADKAAESVFPNQILETVAATCTVGDSDVQKTLCWVVSLKPDASTAIPLQGPDPDYNEKHSQVPTVEIVLVDGNDGSVIVAFQNGFQPEPTASTS